MQLCTMMYELFDREGIDLVLSLPCNKLQDLIGNMPDRFRHIHLTREENGVGISAGAYLTSGKPVMLIQSTGLGNSFNALASLHKPYRLPLPIIATWRGRENDLSKFTIPFGKALPGIFNALEIPYAVIENPEQIPDIGKAIHDAFRQSTPYIILICPEFWDTNEEKMVLPAFETRKRCVQLSYEGKFDTPVLTRLEAIETMSDIFHDAIVLSTIGKTCDDLYQVGDRDLNFYILGAMGQASAIGLGMALNTHGKVFVLDGDGSLLMNPNIFCEIAAIGPVNLTIIVLDNGTYGTTGDQKSAAYDKIDLELVVRSFGIKNTKKATTGTELVQALKSFGEGPNLLHVGIKPGKSEGIIPPLTPVQMKERFLKAFSRMKLNS